jgi:hypothetical protein
MSQEKKLQLILPIATYQRMMQYVDVADTEITGFADVEYDVDRHALIAGSVYLLEQEATGADCEMSEETISNFTVECVKSGMTQLPRLWWHSHVNMGAFFSGTDDQAMIDLENGSFSVALVLNKKREMLCTLNIYNPVMIRIDNVPIAIQYTTDEVPDEIINEVAAKVKTKVYQAPASDYWKDREWDTKQKKWVKKGDKQMELPSRAGQGTGYRDPDDYMVKKNGIWHDCKLCSDLNCQICEEFWLKWYEDVVTPYEQD